VRVAVVGYGVEGRAAVDYWRARGDEVVVHDRRPGLAVPAGVEVADRYLAGLESADLVVRSPGVRPDLLPPGVPVTSVVAEFLARCPAPVVGVTGTKGKGTTSSAIASILRAAGERVFLGGNIGTTPLAFLPSLTPDDVVVLELSSFQLMDLTVSPQVAVVLSITPDHLNWHTDLAEYYRAKSTIAAFQTPSDRVVYMADNEPSAAIAALSPGRRIPVGEPGGVHVRDGAVHVGEVRVLDVADIPLLGPHNVVNVCAAVGATYDLVGGSAEAIRSGVRDVVALPHRLAVVATRRGVTYVDDSCSTTPETTIAAMASFDAPQVLILGGSPKGVEFDALAADVARRKVRGILLVGSEAPRIEAALTAAGVVGDVERVPGPMPDVVARAAALAHPGDVVLLSPACASLEDFRDYADRGDQFTAAVRALGN
jgi:UDP-N-acetylmuramoylalanine--D-glutamate ligase